MVQFTEKSGTITNNKHNMNKEQLRDYLLGIITPLLDYPDAAKVEFSSDDMGALYTIAVDDADFGKLIGRGGATIGAVRSVFTAVGMRYKVRAAIKVNVPINTPRDETI